MFSTDWMKLHDQDLNRSFCARKHEKTGAFENALATRSQVNPFQNTRFGTRFGAGKSLWALQTLKNGDQKRGPGFRKPKGFTYKFFKISRIFADFKYPPKDPGALP